MYSNQLNRIQKSSSSSPGLQDNHEVTTIAFVLPDIFHFIHSLIDTKSTCKLALFYCIRLVRAAKIYNYYVVFEQSSLV